MTGPSTYLVALVLIAAGLANPLSAYGQSTESPTEGTTAGAIAGVLLGSYSGALASNLGSIIWCTETVWGVGCVRTMTAIGAVVGGTAGTILGANDPEALEATAIRAAIGFGIGGAFGIGSKFAKSAVGWRDALMLGLIGGAFGAKPLGTAVGFAGGLIVGWGVSAVVPGFGLPEVAATALAGMAIGVLADWVLSASEARSDETTGTTFSIPLVRLSL